MAQVPGKQRRRGGAVDIVIAEDGDLFAARRRVRDALRGGFHLRHGVGIGHQFADGRIEKILDRVDVDVAPGQHPRQHLRQLIALRDRQRPRRAARVEPVAPQLSGRGMGDAEKRRRRFDGQCGCGKRHVAFSTKGNPDRPLDGENAPVRYPYRLRYRDTTFANLIRNRAPARLDPPFASIPITDRTANAEKIRSAAQRTCSFGALERRRDFRN